MTAPVMFDRNGIDPLAQVMGAGAEIPLDVIPMRDPVTGEPMLPAAGDQQLQEIVALQRMEDDLRAAEAQRDAEGRAGPQPLVILAEPRNEEDKARRRRALSALYGEGFPALKPNATEEDWADWPEQLWDDFGGPHQERVHFAIRNRMMRLGAQWITTRGSGYTGQWEVPAKPSTKVRAVINMIGPALDWRLQVQTEQKPGVKVIPTTNDPDDRGKATASQRLAEALYRSAGLARARREAAYWSQTDGVSFYHTFWDPTAGPKMRDEATGRLMPAGDVRHDVTKIENVRVSLEATATRDPMIVIVTEEIPHAQAVADYGDKVADEGPDGASSRGRGLDSEQSSSTARATGESRQFGPDKARLRGAKTVTKRTLYCAPSEYLPNGLTLVVVGRKVVFLYGLLCGRIPLTPCRDGTSDPAYFPRPVMEQWIEEQMILNTLYSKLLTNIARNSGGRFFYQAKSVRPDTVVSGQDVMVEVRSTQAINDAILPVQGFSIGQDALGAIEAVLKRLEDLTGYNEVARGGTTDQSGRAILAVREQLERTFAPAVTAECEAIKGVTSVSLAFCAAFYEIPRAIRTLGKSRPDLGKLITKDDIDGAADIELDPETMMPTPMSVRNFVLEDRLAKGLITPAEFRRRDRFGFLDDLETPDELHAGRAMRFVEGVREGQITLDMELMVPHDGLTHPEPMLWQDDEDIWQGILDRELILAPDVPPEHRAVADARWQSLAQQAMQKSMSTMQLGLIPSPENPMDPERGALAPAMQGMMAPMGPGGAPQPSGAGAPIDPSAGTGSAGVPMDPRTQPTSAMPGSSAMPAQSLMQDQTTQSQAARLFEASALQ